MKLYYSNGACSLTVRITLHEMGIPCEYEAVNLKTVSEELKNLEKETQTTNATIAAYCKELGIDTPF